MATPHDSCEAPRQTTEQDVPLPRQPVVGCHRYGGRHRPGKDVGPPPPHPRDESQKHSCEREVEPPARRIFHHTAKSAAGECRTSPGEEHQQPAAYQKRGVAASFGELAYGGAQFSSAMKNTDP